jgi:hypothetical protein
VVFGFSDEASNTKKKYTTTVQVLEMRKNEDKMIYSSQESPVAT